MKKYLSITIAFAMTLSMMGCGIAIPDMTETSKEDISISIPSIENVEIDISEELAELEEIIENIKELEEELEEGNESVQSSPATVTGELQFETVDINGNPVDQDIILGSKLVILNLWEPWCGPCVNEIPELQKLYENYKDQGLLIIGAYQDYDDEAEWIVDDAGVTYPIVKVDSNLYKYEQEYVPSSFFFDGNGNLLDEDPLIGALNYEGWEYYVNLYLQ